MSADRSAAGAPQVKAGAGSGTEAQHDTVRRLDARRVDGRFHLPDKRNPDRVKCTEGEKLSVV